MDVNVLFVGGGLGWLGRTAKASPRVLLASRDHRVGGLADAGSTLGRCLQLGPGQQNPESTVRFVNRIGGVRGLLHAQNPRMMGDTRCPGSKRILESGGVRDFPQVQNPRTMGDTGCPHHES